MSVGISYMGTKKELAPLVAQVIDLAQPGSVLDVFSGMCSVGEAVAPFRQVWANDIQKFASEVAAALFTSIDEPLRPVSMADKFFNDFAEHREILSSNFTKSLQEESKLLEAQDFDSFCVQKNILASAFCQDKERICNQVHCLFAKTYANAFFGISQSIEIDSIFSAIKNSVKDKAITPDHRRWLIIGLGRAMLKISNSTGHFAQFLKPKETTFKKFIRQRQRSVWNEWLNSSDEMQVIGTLEWRKKNKTFNEDTITLIPSLIKSEEKPGVIYADPPYTDDQYSRYYHVFETLIMYDYPEVTGAGLYRKDRFRTPFSLKAQAALALEKLIASTSRLGSDLVLSYPTNGLICNSGLETMNLLKKHFRQVELCHAVPHTHSTFGASKGPSRSSVTEQIFLARS